MKNLREEIAKKTYSFRIFRLQKSLLTPSWENANIHIKKACFEFSDIILSLLNKQLEQKDRRIEGLKKEREDSKEIAKSYIGLMQDLEMKIKNQLEGIVVVEECPEKYCKKGKIGWEFEDGKRIVGDHELCKGTGFIERPVTWEDIDIKHIIEVMEMVMKLIDQADELYCRVKFSELHKPLQTKSGGRLKVK